MSAYDEIYHKWAHQLKPSASRGAVSFYGTKAKSYGAVIGMICDNPRGERAYLVSTGRYSNTTSRHQGILRCALPDDVTAFYIPFLSDRSGDIKDNGTMLLSLLDEAKDFADKIVKARKNADEYRARSLEKMQEAIRFAAFFDVALPESYAGLDLTDPANIAAATQAAQDKVAADRVEAARLADEKRERDNAERLEAWMSGQQVYGYFSLQFARMRIKGDRIETTQGASAPLDEVRAAKPIILRAMTHAISTGKEFVPPVDMNISFDGYKLSRISPEGTVVIGCHWFKPEEIQRIAALI